MKKALHVFYSGRVQGVGFRFAVLNIAEELKVIGWVKNLSDGRVEITAESDEDNLKEFLSRVESSFNHYIKETQVSWGFATGEFRNFSIRF